jgi:hypothetical protein
MKELNQNAIDELFKDKRVILVGNSVELMNFNYADYIDSFDVVVRFGKAISAGEKEQKAIGKKIDVWATGSFRAAMIQNQKYKDLIEKNNTNILFNRARMDFKKRLVMEPYIDKIGYDMFQDDEIREIYSRYGLTDDASTSRLSIGTITTMFMCEKVKNYKSLTLLGFDLFKKSTSKRRNNSAQDSTSWHLPIIGSTDIIHDHDLEKSIIRQYAEDGLLEWNIISDLKPTLINNTYYGNF